MNCLITGASLGIGHALALKMASIGYNLVLTYYTNQEKCQELKKEIEEKYKVKCFIEKCNLKKEEDIINIINLVKEKFKTLDILVNNASMSNDNLIENKTKEEFNEVLEVNITGTFLISKYALKILNKNGIIINMASTDGIDTYSIYNIDYAISKAGIIQLTKSLALINQDIRVIAIAPNWVDTESTKEINKEYLINELKRVNQTKLISKNTVVNKIIDVINDKTIRSGEVIKIYE